MTLKRKAASGQGVVEYAGALVVATILVAALVTFANAGGISTTITAVSTFMTTLAGKVGSLA